MVIVTRYSLKKADDGKIEIKNPPPARCEKCGCWLTVHDRRERKAKNPQGEQVVYRLRRLRCKKCKAIHLEMPDCLVKNKHYDAESVNRPDMCAAEDSTIRRWKRRKQ